jgi:hypothetical protein
MLRALREAGHTVVILTAIAASDPSDPKAAWAAKVQQLHGLDCDDCWDSMMVFDIPDGPKLAVAKSDACKSLGVALFIENNVANAKAAVNAGVPMVLVPQATRVKNK